MADLLQVIRIRVLRWLARHGVIDDGALLGVVEVEVALFDSTSGGRPLALPT